MVTALINTLLGMGIVFVVLIFISFIIYLLGFVPKLFDRTKKSASNEQPAKVVQPTPAPVSSTVEDDSELVAVIAAAVAATMSEVTGQPVAADGLVIRSIKRRR